MCEKERAIKYFRLGEQYCETAKLLFETLISNENSNAGVGKTLEDACRELEKNAPKSDLYLFIPAIFNCLQSTELFAKGLLLFNKKSFEREHGIEKLLESLKNIYNEDSKIYLSLKTFYENQIEIIKDYKQINGLTNSYDLYMPLRYPEITLSLTNNGKKDISIDYMKLMYNGKKGIEQFKILLENLETIKLVIVKEYHANS